MEESIMLMLIAAGGAIISGDPYPVDNVRPEMCADRRDRLERNELLLQARHRCTPKKDALFTPAEIHRLLVC